MTRTRTGAVWAGICAAVLIKSGHVRVLVVVILQNTGRDPPTSSPYPIGAVEWVRNRWTADAGTTTTAAIAASWVGDLPWLSGANL